MPKNILYFKRLFILLVIVGISSIAISVYLLNSFSRETASTVEVVSPMDSNLLENSITELRDELRKLSQFQQEVLKLDDELRALIRKLEVENLSAPVLAPPQKVEDNFSTVSLHVMPGDSLWSIVSRFYKSPTPEFIAEIAKINGISDPKKIPVGFLITIPLPNKSSGYEVIK